MDEASIQPRGHQPFNATNQTEYLKLTLKNNAQLRTAFVNFLLNHEQALALELDKFYGEELDRKIGGKAEVHNLAQIVDALKES